MSVRMLVLMPLALLVACGGDADGDGLTNKEEKELGLDKKLADTDGDGMSDGDEVTAGADPLVTDSDGDGLLDGEEVEHGCDPTIVDTDEDSYTDFDEVNEGSDPADSTSRIYKGRWPYYAGKDGLNGGGFSAGIEVGKRFARFKAVDQYGDTVDLFDFYNEEGKPVVIDISAQWCGPCQNLAAWMDGEEDAYYEGLWPGGPEAVKNGDVYWVTIIGENFDREPATKETATEWFEAFPSKKIPVLAEEDGTLLEYAQLGWWPYTLLLTPDLKLDGDGSDGYSETVLGVLAGRGL